MTGITAMTIKDWCVRDMHALGVYRKVLSDV